MFEAEADIRYAIVDVTIEMGDPQASVSNISPLGDSSFPFKWFTPTEQPVLVVPGGRDVYLLVAPGQEMLNTIVAKRQATRGKDSAHWSGMVIPTFECVTYCQGLVMDEKQWRGFGYLVEVES
jgi:hypothetical protein